MSCRAHGSWAHAFSFPLSRPPNWSLSQLLNPWGKLFVAGSPAALGASAYVDAEDDDDPAAEDDDVEASSAAPCALNEAPCASSSSNFLLIASTAWLNSGEVFSFCEDCGRDASRHGEAARFARGQGVMAGGGVGEVGRGQCGEVAR